MNLLVSVVSAGVTFGLTYLAFTHWLSDAATVSSYLMVLVVMASALFAHAAAFSFMRSSALALAMAEDLWWVLGQTVFVAFGVFGFIVAFKDHAVSRTFLFSFLGLLPISLTLARKIGQRWVAPILFDRGHQCGTLLVGKPSESLHLLHWLKSKGCYGLKVLGWVTNEECESVSLGHPVLGRTDDLEQVIAEMRPGVVMTTSFDSMGHKMHWLRATCDRYGARLAFSFGLPGDLPCGITCYQEGGVSLLAFRNEPLESPFNRMVKRAFDIAISVPVVLFVLPPLALVVKLIQICQSPGPLLFKQVRGGLANSSFIMLKFRTMHCLDHDEAVQASERDPRVYPLGRWLRKLSLDEFPQFLNVLMGHMSVVGPRPHFAVHDEQFAEITTDYRVRALIKPGITGLAQVRGFRGPTLTDEDVRIRTRSDLFYLENWSFLLDVTIIARTALQFLSWTKRAF